MFELEGDFMSRALEHTEYGFVKDKGQWKCYCTVPDVKLPSGKSWRPNAYGKTKKAAREKLECKLEAKAEELARKIEQSENNQLEAKEKPETTKSSNTLVEQLRTYAVLKQEGKVKAAGKKIKKRSIDDKYELIRNLIEPYAIGKIEVGKLTRKNIIDWLEELKKAGKSEKRQKGAYNLLTDYYNNYYCMEVNPEFVSPATGFRFEIKKSKADPMKILDNSETKLYLKTCEEMGSKADVLQFILYTYCREGEADTLTWSDWNQSNLIHIHKTWSKDENGKYYVDSKPKTKDSDRYIYLSEQVQILLTARYAEVEGTELGKPDAWIFPSLTDKTKPLSESTTYGLHKQVLKRAKLKNTLRVHDLRHSGVSYTIRNSKVDCVSAISKQAGHSSRAITESIYEHVIDAQSRQLAEISTQIYEAVCPM